MLFSKKIIFEGERDWMIQVRKKLTVSKKYVFLRRIIKNNNEIVK